MKTIKEIKKIIAEWAITLPVKVRIHVFGSYLKGKENPSDLDISLEILDNLSADELLSISIHNRKDWQNYLSEIIEMAVDLQLYDKSMKHMTMYLAEASLLLYDSSEREVVS